jgi:hypothetical protein
MNAYGSDTLSAAAATDTLTAAVRLGKLEPEALAGAMGMVLPIASAMGVQFDEVAAAMAAMSRTGTDAATGATQLRQILAQLTKPTTQAQKALESVGLSVEGVQKSLREDGLLATLKLLQGRFKGNVTAMSSVFGNIRALSGVLDMLGSNVADTEAIFKDMADTTGELDAAFAIASDTAGFKMRQALAELQVALIKIGDVIAPIIAKVAEFVGAFLNQFNKLPGGVQQVIAVLGLLAAAVGPVLWALGIMGKAFVALYVGPATKLIGVFKTIAATATTNFGIVAAQAKAMSLMTIAKFGAIGLAAAAVGIALKVMADQQAARAEQRFKTLTGSVEALNRALLAAARNGAITGALKDLKTIMVDLKNETDGNTNSFAKMFAGPPGMDSDKGPIPNFLTNVKANADKARESLGVMDAELAALAAVDLETANSAFQSMQAYVESLGGEVDELSLDKFPLFKSIVEQAADAMGMTVPDFLELAAAGGAIGDEFGEAADAISAARSQLNEWQEELRAAIDPVYALDKAQQDHTGSLRDLEIAQLDAWKALSDTGADSPEYVAAMGKVEEAERKVISSAFDLVTAEDDLRVAIDDGTVSADKFKNAHQMLVDRGLVPTKDMIDKVTGETETMISTLEGTPPTVKTFVTSNAQDVWRDAIQLQGELDGLERVRQVVIRARIENSVSNIGSKLEGLFPGMATGGPVKAARPYMVGERGPELVVPNSDGWVMNHAETRRMLSASNGGGSVATAPGDTYNVTVNGLVGRDKREILDYLASELPKVAARTGRSYS